MAKANKQPWASGDDAAYIKPKMVPNFELLPRDDSGGPDYQPYTMAFGDGGFVHGEKPHLSTGSGREDEELGDEISQLESERNRDVSAKAPTRSKKEQAE